jgi:hypothetical protein
MIEGEVPRPDAPGAGALLLGTAVLSMLLGLYAGALIGAAGSPAGPPAAAGLPIGSRVAYRRDRTT